MMIFYFSSKFGRFEAGGQGHHTIQKHPTLKGAMFSRAEAIGWLESVTAALDCYNWVFRDQLFSPSELFNGNLSLSLSLLSPSRLSTAPPFPHPPIPHFDFLLPHDS